MITKINFFIEPVNITQATYFVNKGGRQAETRILA